MSREDAQALVAQLAGIYERQGLSHGLAISPELARVLARELVAALPAMCDVSVRDDAHEAWERLWAEEESCSIH